MVLCTVKNDKYEVCICVCVRVHVVAVRSVMQVFISAVCGVLYRCVCVGTGGLCPPCCGRGVCSGGSWWRFKALKATTHPKTRVC